MAALKWIRSEKVIGKSQMKTGESIYTSTCGRFVIHQSKGGWTESQVYYLLDVDGQPAKRSFREHDRLVDAKDAANLIADPNYEPVV